MIVGKNLLFPSLFATCLCCSTKGFVQWVLFLWDALLEQRWSSLVPAVCSCPNCVWDYIRDAAMNHLRSCRNSLHIQRTAFQCLEKNSCSWAWEVRGKASSNYVFERWLSWQQNRTEQRLWMPLRSRYQKALKSAYVLLLLPSLCPSQVGLRRILTPSTLEQLQVATTGLLPAFAHELLLTFKYKEPFLVSIHSDLSITFLI